MTQGCLWQQSKFSVDMSASVLDICQECKKEITGVIRKYNGKTLCKDCFCNLPSLKNKGFDFEFNTTRDKLYEFIDTKTFGKPTEIRGKAHWKRELKKRGLSDDFTQDVDQRLREIKKDGGEKIDKKFISNEIHRELYEKNLHNKLLRRR